MHFNCLANGLPRTRALECYKVKNTNTSLKKHFLNQHKISLKIKSLLFCKAVPRDSQYHTEGTVMLQISFLLTLPVQLCLNTYRDYRRIHKMEGLICSRLIGTGWPFREEVSGHWKTSETGAKDNHHRILSEWIGPVGHQSIELPPPGWSLKA